MASGDAVTQSLSRPLGGGKGQFKEPVRPRQVGASPHPLWAGGGPGRHSRLRTWLWSQRGRPAGAPLWLPGPAVEPLSPGSWGVRGRGWPGLSWSQAQPGAGVPGARGPEATPGSHSPDFGFMCSRPSKAESDIKQQPLQETPRLWLPHGLSLPEPEYHKRGGLSGRGLSAPVLKSGRLRSRSL